VEARDQKRGQPMPDRQLVNEIKTLIVAGHETTANTLSWMWYLVSTHPQVEEKLSHELACLDVSEHPRMDELVKFPYTHQVIEETMRLYPSGWLMTRKARNEDLLGDYFVPAATEIYIPPYFIQRNPNLWEMPDSFTRPLRSRPFTQSASARDASVFGGPKKLHWRSTRPRRDGASPDNDRKTPSFTLDR
jgi:cytochrome P450